MKYVLLISITFLFTVSLKSQDTIRINDSTYQIKQTLREPIPDSLVTEDEPINNIYGPKTTKNTIEISNDLCLLMKKIDSKHFTKLKESKIHYIRYVINIDKTGKPLNFNFVYDYICRRYFDLTIINYLKKLNYKAAYIKKKYIC